MANLQTIEIPIKGMDCAECTMHVQRAIRDLPGVEQVDVYLVTEKAVVRLDSDQVDLPSIRQAVHHAGYEVPESARPASEQAANRVAQKYTRTVLVLLGVLFGVILFVVVLGEWLGLFEALSERVPFLLGLALVIAGGYPIFIKVARAALKGQVISHTLMTIGVLAALAIGQWATAAVVVFFMRVGDYVERFTTERARRAIRSLSEMAPQTARLEVNGNEETHPVDHVRIGDTVIVRPGEMIPVDGEVVSGQATVNQATITGEAMPVEASPGAHVYAATLAQLGTLRVRATGVGAGSTFGRVVRLVEQAEAQKGEVQRIADRFSAYYLPVVAGIAGLTYLISRDPLATTAVLVVACSCAFALATPIAMLASIGAGAQRGLMVKGGKYLELLAKADVLLIDKTGTLTLGKPEITDVVVIQSYLDSRGLLLYAASAERYSEHPLAEAVREKARTEKLALEEPQNFEALPGFGVRARVDGKLVEVGNMRMLPELIQGNVIAAHNQASEALEEQGKTVLFVAVDGFVVGMLAAADTPRPETPEAIRLLKELGIREVELLTGDSRRSAVAISEYLGIPYRAELLPEDKIRIVQEYQAQGRTVVIVGDGVNDAPALAQADVGIAMGAAGSPAAIEAAHVALMSEDWMLIPDAFQIAQRTMRVVKGNILFTILFNAVGLTLAAFGFLPPGLAAAAQSLPDLGILANSSRLIRQERAR